MDLLNALARAGERARGVVPVGEWDGFVTGVRDELWPLMSATGRERAARELAALETLPRITSALVHGDLGRENVLWETPDGAPRLSGVVDWDEACLGDRRRTWRRSARAMVRGCWGGYSRSEGGVTRTSYGVSR